MTQDPKNRKLGLWLVGARGAISTCVSYGLSGMRQGLLEPVGLATQKEPLDALSLVPIENLVLGGHDVCSRSLSQAAGELAAAGVLPADLVAAAAGEAAAYESRIRPGMLDTAEVGLADLDPRAAELGALPPLEQIARLQTDLDEFEHESDLGRTVVVFVASSEASRDSQPEWESLEDFENALEAGHPQPASILYAYAALASGRPFVNFTPSLGASVPALRQLAKRECVPHCGNDGKTGETLVKTALAPTFAKRALKVLAWQGYNMLGNRDGEVLRSEAHVQTKLRNKDEALRSILGDDDDFHTKVSIDYVPSLGDWKTAWDYIHFEGFLGAKMSLQFTWQGSDSALAAPLIIDLALLADFAAEAGEVGEMAHTASYFKAPLSGGTHDFHIQHAKLVEYAQQHSASGAGQR